MWSGYVARKKKERTLFFFIKMKQSGKATVVRLKR